MQAFVLLTRRQAERLQHGQAANLGVGKLVFAHQTRGLMLLPRCLYPTERPRVIADQVRLAVRQVGR